jgi:excisionase family DNA binding protein
MSNLFVRVPEVAENLGISRAKVYELMAAGELRSVKIGGCRRVRASDLVEYVEALASAP